MDKRLLKKIGASAILIAINTSGALADHKCTCSACSNNEKSDQEVTISEVQDQTVKVTPDVSLNGPEKSEVESNNQNVTDQTGNENPTGDSTVSLVNENKIPEKALISNSDEVESKLASEEVLAKTLQDYFNSDGFVKGSLQSAFAGWEFVGRQFKIMKLDAIEKLAKHGFSDLNRLNRYSEQYAKFVNNFFNKKHNWDGIIIDKVGIFKNDPISKEIQHSLNLFNYSKQFELINESIENYKNVDWYLVDNAELMEKVIKGLKIALDSKYDSVIDNLDSRKCVSWWIASIFGYMNGAFNFYDNMMQDNMIPRDQLKDILDFEFKYMDKATKSVEDVNKAVTFFYNYAREDLENRLKNAEDNTSNNNNSESETKDQTNSDNSKSAPTALNSESDNQSEPQTKNFTCRYLSISLA